MNLIRRTKYGLQLIGCSSSTVILNEVISTTRLTEKYGTSRPSIEILCKFFYNQAY